MNTSPTTSVSPNPEHSHEKQKRDEPISSPTFHELADEVEKPSRRILSIDRQQERLGDEAPRGEETINEGDQPRSN